MGKKQTIKEHICMHTDNVSGVVDAVNCVKWVRGQENSERLWGHQGRPPNYAETQGK